MKFRKCEKLGEGTYGKVHRVISTDTNEEFAFKRNISQGQGSSEVSRELDILNRLRGNPRVVSLKIVSIGSPLAQGEIMSPIKNTQRLNLRDDVFHFLFELADGDLLTWLNREYHQFQQIKQFMVDILLGVEFINLSGIAHRDLKTANIVVFRPGKDPMTPENSTPTESSPDSPIDFKSMYRVKICDFGLAKPMTFDNLNTPGVTTAWYRAPEVIGGKTNYSIKVDAWAVGCIFYEMLFRVPYTGKIRDATMDIIYSLLKNACYSYSDYEIKNVLGYLGNQRPPTYCASIYDRIMNNQALKTAISASLREPVQVNAAQPYSGGFFSQAPDVNKINRTIKELSDVVQGLLVVDPEKRSSITETLDLPFFDSHRVYIQEFRQKFGPNHPIEWPYRIPNCIERTWINAYIGNIFNNHKSYIWYNHRRMFHAIDLFDRALRYEINKAPVNAIETEYKGRALSKVDTELYFFSCLYISIKYFSSLQLQVSLESFIPVNLRGEANREKMCQIEIKLLRDVFDYSIYRHGFYESVSMATINMTPEQREYIINMGIRKIVSSNLEINGKTPTQLTSEIIKECLG